MAAILYPRLQWVNIAVVIFTMYRLPEPQLNRFHISWPQCHLDVNALSPFCVGKEHYVYANRQLLTGWT